jgi:hypothetical protein
VRYLQHIGVAVAVLLLFGAALISAPGLSAHTNSPGDVDCSGNANSIDASLILQYSAGLTSSLECLDDANVNSDASINSVDASLILQYSAGLISSL